MDKALIMLKKREGKGDSASTPAVDTPTPAEEMDDEARKLAKLRAIMGGGAMGGGARPATRPPPEDLDEKAMQKLQKTFQTGMERTVVAFFGLEKNEDRETRLARTFAHKWMAKTFVTDRRYRFSERWHKQPIFFEKREEHDGDEEEALLPYSDAERKKRKIKQIKHKEPPTKERSFFIWGVTAIQCLMLWVEIFLNNGFQDMAINPFMGPDVKILVMLGGLYGPAIVDDGEYWRFITSIFLHVGILHLVFNLALQVTIGKKLEQNYGFWRTGIMYILAGIGGNFVSAVFLPDQLLVGCSGSLYGFFGILIVDCIQHWRFLKKPWKNLGIILAVTIVSMMVGLLPGVDNFAHLGGLVFGLLLAIIFLPNVTFGKWDVRIKAGLSVISGLVCLALFLGLYFIFKLGVDPHGWCPGCKYITCIPINDWCDGLQ